MMFCSIPSLGEKLNKKGASYVLWASESGIILGDYLKLRTNVLPFLYVVLEEKVIEIYSGKNVKFEEEEGITYLRRGTGESSRNLPGSNDGFICMGG